MYSDLSICLLIMYLFVSLCIYLFLYVCMYVCMHACMHVCMYVCIYICTYIYTVYIYIDRHSISMHLICTYNWNCSPLKGQQDLRKAQHSDFAWHVHGPALSPSVEDFEMQGHQT